MAFRQTMSINDLPRTRQTGIAADRNSSHRIPRCPLAKCSCSHHQFMLDRFLSTCGAHTRFRVTRTSMREFLVSKNFRHHPPHPLPHSAELSANSGFPATRSRAIILCTTHVAVIHSLLDNTKSSRSNPVCAKKFLREVFHAAKYFVLVCRLFYLLKFLRPGTRSQQTGGALH